MIQKKNPSKCHSNTNSKTTDKKLNMHSVSDVTTRIVLERKAKLRLECEENRIQNKYLKTKARKKMARKSRQINRRINKK